MKDSQAQEHLIETIVHLHVEEKEVNVKCDYRILFFLEILYYCLKMISFK